MVEESLEELERPERVKKLKKIMKLEYRELSKRKVNPLDPDAFLMMTNYLDRVNIV